MLIMATEIFCRECGILVGTIKEKSTMRVNTVHLCSDCYDTMSIMISQSFNVNKKMYNNEDSVNSSSFNQLFNTFFNKKM